MTPSAPKRYSPDPLHLPSSDIYGSSRYICFPHSHSVVFLQWPLPPVQAIVAYRTAIVQALQRQSQESIILSRLSYYDILGRTPLPSPSEYPAVKVIPDTYILFTSKSKVLSAECLEFVSEHLLPRCLKTLCSFKVFRFFSLKIEVLLLLLLLFYSLWLPSPSSLLTLSSTSIKSTLGVHTVECHTASILNVLKASAFREFSEYLFSAKTVSRHMHKSREIQVHILVCGHALIEWGEKQSS